MHHPRCVLCKLGGGGVHQNTTVFVPYLFGWRHVSATVGHPQVTKIYNQEKIYSIRSLLVVHILSFQRDLIVMRLSILKLLDTWDQNGSTSGPTAWKIYDDGWWWWWWWWRQRHQ